MSAFRLARRNLTQSRTRFAIAAGGVALALTLILTLDAVFAGVARQLTTYIDRSGADVIVGQRGVRNLHMVASWLPADIVDAVSGIDGVAAAEPLLYVTDTLALGDERFVAYVMAPEAGASMGGPWQVSEGSGTPDPGEVLIDAAVASEAGVGLGDPATVRGRTLQIAGLIEGTSTLLNSIAFIAPEDFLATSSGADLTSFVLVRTDEGAAPQIVATRIEDAIDAVSALARSAFAAEERRLVTDMADGEEEAGGGAEERLADDDPVQVAPVGAQRGKHSVLSPPRDRGDVHRQRDDCQADDEADDAHDRQDVGRHHCHDCVPRSTYRAEPRAGGDRRIREPCWADLRGDRRHGSRSPHSTASRTRPSDGLPARSRLT